MLQPFSKILVIFMMMIAFFGQAAAYSISVTMNVSTDAHSVIDTASISADSLATSNSSSDDCCDVECCEAECICPANTCTTTLYLPNEEAGAECAASSHSIFPHNTQRPTPIVKSLFRPPIVTS
ncbi:hypothetical protein [Pseudoalteromonas sp. MMG005]|uniref:hypothetical protein n=1 Tax=Pseudoalteromonas sp. MMG005 TaxID=2822682 RepID=UPI001B39DB5F|nr:hypothetical protein [Pseudoalteromonas sp. MMG005]MBQ4846037.1 hypothetical protein [Pseudoalteromonas sp. MMG005]